VSVTRCGTNGKRSGFVSHQQDGDSLGDVPQHAARGRTPLHPVRRAHDPERALAVIHFHRLVVDDAEARAGERRGDARAAEPVVVVAEDGEQTERRAQVPQDPAALLGGNESPAHDPLDHQVPEEEDDVRMRGVGHRDDPPQLLSIDVGGSGVDVREEGEAQAAVRLRPPRKAHGDLPFDEAARLEPEGPSPEQEEDGRGACERAPRPDEEGSGREHGPGTSGIGGRLGGREENGCRISPQTTGRPR
jgi:hypothetical protein